MPSPESATSDVNEASGEGGSRRRGTALGGWAWARIIRRCAASKGSPWEGRGLHRKINGVNRFGLNLGSARKRDSVGLGQAMRGPGLLGPLTLMLALGLGGVHGLSFHLPPQTRKCLKEELHRDVMVTGEYEVSEAAAPGVRTDLRVSGSGLSRPHPAVSSALLCCLNSPPLRKKNVGLRLLLYFSRGMKLVHASAPSVSTGH